MVKQKEITKQQAEGIVKSLQQLQELGKELVKVFENLAIAKGKR